MEKRFSRPPRKTFGARGTRDVFFSFCCLERMRSHEEWARDESGNSAYRERGSLRRKPAPTLAALSSRPLFAGNHLVPLYYLRATRTIVRAFSLYGEKSKSP